MTAREKERRIRSPREIDVRYTNLDRRSSFECVSPRLLLLPPLFFLLLLLLALLHLRAGVDAAVSDVVETPRGYLSTSDDRSALSFSVSPFFEEGVLPFPCRIKHKLSVRLSLSHREILRIFLFVSLSPRTPSPARTFTLPHRLPLSPFLFYSLTLYLSLSLFITVQHTENGSPTVLAGRPMLANSRTDTDKGDRGNSAASRIPRRACNSLPVYSEGGAA